LYWEAAFSLFAAVLLTFTGLAFLRSESLTKKWQRKLKKALKNHKAFENMEVNVDMKNQGASDAAMNSGIEGKDSLMSENSGPSTTNIIISEESRPNEHNQNESHETNEAAEKRSLDAYSESSDRTLVKTISKSEGAWALFMIPFITVMREGLEGVVFILGISLGVPYGHIPLAAVTGILCVRSYSC
jgi:high-affinity iron transporter